MTRRNCPDFGRVSCHIQIALLVTTLGLGLTSCSGEHLSMRPAAAFSSSQAPKKKSNQWMVSLAAQPEALSRIAYGSADYRTVLLKVEAAAQLQANANAVTKVAAPISGKVTEVHACLGDSVKKGQCLATITSQEIGTQVTELFRNESEIDSDLATELMEIDFQLKQTCAELALCKKQQDRAQLLLEEKIGSLAALEMAQTESEKHDLLISALEAKKVKARKIAEEKKRIGRVSLEQKLMVLGMPKETIKKIVSDRNVINCIPIHAPQSGIVLERNINLGELVDPSKTLFIIDDIDTLWLVADIFEQDVANVRAGQEIEFQVDSFPGQTFKGKLDFVAGTINPDTRTLAVRAVVNNPGFRLKPKLFAHMKIFAQSHKVLAISQKAVQDAGSRKVVYLPHDNGQFEERCIKLGEESGDYVEVLDGLKPGDKIVTNGSFTLRAQSLKQGR